MVFFYTDKHINIHIEHQIKVQNNQTFDFLKLCTFYVYHKWGMIRGGKVFALHIFCILAEKFCSLVLKLKVLIAYNTHHSHAIHEKH